MPAAPQDHVVRRCPLCGQLGTFEEVLLHIRDEHKGVEVSPDSVLGMRLPTANGTAKNGTAAVPDPAPPAAPRRGRPPARRAAADDEEEAEEPTILEGANAGPPPNRASLEVAEGRVAPRSVETSQVAMRAKYTVWLKPSTLTKMQLILDDLDNFDFVEEATGGGVIDGVFETFFELLDLQVKVVRGERRARLYAEMAATRGIAPLVPAGGEAP